MLFEVRTPYSNNVKSNRKFDKTCFKDSIQQPSVFAQLVDNLRSKSEAELKMLYLQLSANDLEKEWKNITADADFTNTTEEDIIKAVQKKRYRDSMYKIVLMPMYGLNYARAKDTAPLLNRLLTYRLAPIVNNYLISEVFDALIENKWMAPKRSK